MSPVLRNERPQLIWPDLLAEVMSVTCTDIEPVLYFLRCSTVLRMVQSPDSVVEVIPVP
jgi:hypothetical protein